MLTRPLGASFADWTGKSRHAGGLGVGDGTISFLLALLIVAGVAYLAITRSDQLAGDDASYRRVLADDAA